MPSPTLPLVAAFSMLLLAGCESVSLAEGPAGAAGAAGAPGAVAELRPTTGNNASGTVRFTQQRDGVMVQVRVSGLTPGQQHGFHVHEKGDCSSGDGMSAGGHFNPTSKPHGPQDGEHHAGDLPSLKADSNGVAEGVYTRRRHQHRFGRRRHRRQGTRSCMRSPTTTRRSPPATPARALPVRSSRAPRPAARRRTECGSTRHCHLDAAEFDADRDAVVARARAGGRRPHRAAGGRRAQLRCRAGVGANARARATRSAFIRWWSTTPTMATSTACAMRCSATMTTRRWWRSARSGSTTSSPGLDRERQQRFYIGAAEARARVRAAGAVAQPARGRCGARRPAPHRRRAGRHCACLQRQRTAGRLLRRPRLQARLRRRDDVRARAAHPRARRAACPSRRRCSRPMRPTSRRNGSTAPPPSAPPARPCATSRASCRASQGRWPRCAAGRSTTPLAARRQRQRAAALPRRGLCGRSASTVGPFAPASLHWRPVRP